MTTEIKPKSLKHTLVAPGHIAVMHLTHSDYHGSHHLILSFSILEQADESDVLFRSSHTASERALCGLAFKGFWNDMGGGGVVAYDGMKLTAHEPEQWEVEKAIPVMRHLNNALTKHRTLTQDNSFASSAVALSNAAKVDRMEVRYLRHTGKQDLRVAPSFVHDAVKQVVEDFEELHRGTRLGRTA